MSAPPLPLSGLRVMELGTVIAAPFCCSLLAELGAEVLKIERPGEGGGDALRNMGVRDAAGRPVWWGVASRNKRLATLDLKGVEGRARFEELAAEADVLVENNRPGVMDRLGLGYAALSASNPRLVMLSISGFGATGPLAPRPGFGKIAEAMSGMVVLTGEPGKAPLHVGFSLADTAAGLMGLYGVALALWLRDAGGSGKGLHLDLALYEPLLRMAECQLALAHLLGRPPTRQGTNDPQGWGAPGGNRAVRALRCAEGEWVAVLAQGRAATMPELEQLCARLPRAEALAALRGLGLQAAPVQDGRSLAEAPYFAARRDILAADNPGAEPRLAVPGFAPSGAAYDRSALRAFRRPETEAEARWTPREETPR